LIIRGPVAAGAEAGSVAADISAETAIGPGNSAAGRWQLKGAQAASTRVKITC
jgi:hypothetical protein